MVLNNTRYQNVSQRLILHFTYIINKTLTLTIVDVVSDYVVRPEETFLKGILNNGCAHCHVNILLDSDCSKESILSKSVNHSHWCVLKIKW